MSSDTNTTVHPIIPFPFPFYDSYEIDPQWQIKFTVIWASVLGFATLLALPAIFRSIHPKRLLAGLLGIRESRTTRNYAPIASLDCDMPPLTLGDGRRRNRIRGFFRALGAFAYITPPKLGLNISQIILILGYLGAVAYCIVVESPLVRHPNRAGFLTLAQLPVVILFGTKNSILGLLLGPGNGYERLNFIHRWAGRGMFLAALTHGSLWTRNRVGWGHGIADSRKTKTGLAALIFLFLITLTSLPIIRRLARRLFFAMHVISFTAFCIVIFYHTPFASFWLYPPILLYALDVLLRFFRYRMKDATLIAIDDQMTLIRIPDCGAGWDAGQHVQLRVFFSNRFMESHPLSIVTAPPSTSCLSSEGIILAARVNGAWSKALNDYANTESQRVSTPSVLTFKGDAEMSAPEVPIRVMLDGPYGGCSIDLGRYENVMLIAGGSGVTFTIGLLDDLVGRCAKLRRLGNEKTSRVEFVWCIRSFDSLAWFAPLLATIINTAMKSSLELHLSIFITSHCPPLPVINLPNTEVRIGRPCISAILHSFASMPPGPSRFALDKENGGGGALAYGGMGVCVSGPDALTREVANTVVQINLTQGMRLGGVSLHTEKFSL